MNTKYSVSQVPEETVGGSKPYAACDPLYSDRDAAAFLGCGRSTLWRWASDGIIPRPLKIGGASRWRLSDLQDVIETAAANREAA